MAEQIYRLASFNGEDVTADMIWEDTTSNAVALLYTNVTTRPASLTATKKSGSVSRTIEIPPDSHNVRDDLPAPLSVNFDARGNLRGWRFTMVWPSD